MDRLAEVTATVIGVGAIGRQVALQLASIGTPRIQLIDFDSVDLSNTTTQGYRKHEIGQAKPFATSQAISEIDPSIEVIQVKIVFDHARKSAMQSSAASTRLPREQQSGVQFNLAWDSGPMAECSAKCCEFLPSRTANSEAHYASTLFAASEAQQGTCTSRSTVYAASIAAGIMVHQFTRWLRDIPTDADTSVNLLSGEWTVRDAS